MAAAAAAPGMDAADQFQDEHQFLAEGLRIARR